MKKTIFSIGVVCLLLSSPLLIASAINAEDIPIYHCLNKGWLERLSEWLLKTGAMLLIVGIFITIVSLIISIIHNQNTSYYG